MERCILKKTCDACFLINAIFEYQQMSHNPSKSWSGPPLVVLMMFYIYFLNFNCRLITLQYCSGFCHIFTWISHGCTCVPHPEPLSHLPPHPIPQGHPSAPALSTLSNAWYRWCFKIDWFESRFDAWGRMLTAGALGWPWGMGWGGRWEGRSKWGTHVHPWLIHVNVWQNHYNIVK